ncbi:MAG: GH32 C-terminal domain-containing protein [Ferruginibacter sp.]
MIQKLLYAFLLLLVLQTGMAQDNKPATRNISTYFTAEKKYLVLPVKNGAPKRNIELWVDGVNTRFFDMELAEGKPDWYAYLKIDEWAGKPIELRVDKVDVDSKVFSPVQQSDLDTNAGTLYKEKLRGQLHFSQKRGWTNDPNGMVYYNGEYHLFFQHNPYGREWGNMTWGHAVSKDLVHWKELDDALHPDKFGPVFSGGAVVDSNNTSGLGTAGKPAMVMFHTGARAWAQCLSWSTDGRTFQTLDHAVVPRINKDNRDPKVVWYEPTKKWVMVVWVERGNNEQHSMQILTSPDLKNWTRASMVMGGTGNDRYLFECPEFYELPVEGTSEKKWVLTGANTQYAIGTFDGTTFKPAEERLQGQHGRDFYAPQTFSDVPNGRRIEIGWWRTHTGKGDMVFNQSQSLPLEHKLVRTPEGIRLTRMPVKELESLRIKTYKLGKVSVKENGKNPLKDIDIELAEMRLEITPGKSREVVIDVRGVPVTYNATSQELTVDGVKAPAILQNGKLSLVIYADRTGLEIFVNNGLVYMPININLQESNRSLSISAKGGTAKVEKLEVYELKSIWE